MLLFSLLLALLLALLLSFIKPYISGAYLQLSFAIMDDFQAELTPLS
jgi:hypothetical protein